MSPNDILHFKETRIDKIHNYISSNILVILAITIVLLGIICFILYHFFYFDFSFIFAPFITLSVPYIIIGYNKHKEENQNSYFKKIIDESIFESAMEVKIALLEISSSEFKKTNPTEIEENKEYRMLDVLGKKNTLESLNTIKRIYKITYEEIKIIQESKLQFYDFNTFKKFSKYKFLFCSYEEKMKNLDFDIALDFYSYLYEFSNKLNKNQLEKTSL